MGDLRIIGKGAMYVFVGLLISKIMSYVWRVVVSRIGAENYGLISLALAILGISYSISSLGLGSAVTRYVAYYHGTGNVRKMKGVIISSLKLAVSISLATSAIIFIYSEQISLYVFKNPNLSPILKIISFGIVPYIIYILAIAALIGLKKIESVVFSMQIVESTTRLIVTLILLYLGYGVLGVGVAYVAAYFFGAVSAIYALEKAVHFLGTKINIPSIKWELLSYSLPLLFGDIIIQAISWTDTLMIGYFKTASDVGIYNIALPTASLILIIPSALTAIFLPTITSAYAKGFVGDVKELYRRITKLIIAANLPILLLMIFFSENILIFLFGIEYSAGSSSLVFLSIGSFVSSVLSTNGAILNMLKKTKISMAISVISTLINVGLNYVLIPKYGIIGAAFASAISLIFGGLSLNFFAFKYLKMVPFDRSIVYLSICGILSMGVMYFGLHARYATIPLVPAIIGVSFFLTVYAGLVLWFRIITLKEISQIIRIFKKE